VTTTATQAVHGNNRHPCAALQSYSNADTWGWCRMKALPMLVNAACVLLGCIFVSSPLLNLRYVTSTQFDVTSLFFLPGLFVPGCSDLQEAQTQFPLQAIFFRKKACNLLIHIPNRLLILEAIDFLLAAGLLTISDLLFAAAAGSPCAAPFPMVPSLDPSL